MCMLIPGLFCDEFPYFYLLYLVGLDMPLHMPILTITEGRIRIEDSMPAVKSVK